MVFKTHDIILFFSKFICILGKLIFHLLFIFYFSLFSRLKRVFRNNQKLQGDGGDASFPEGDGIYFLQCPILEQIMLAHLFN